MGCLATGTPGRTSGMNRGIFFWKDGGELRSVSGYPFILSECLTCLHLFDGYQNVWK
jgi:hypothetical protein